jgi:hypothetical protein
MEYANIALIDTMGRVCIHRSSILINPVYSATVDLFVDKEGHALDESIKELSELVGVSPSTLLDSSKITRRKEVNNFLGISKSKKVHLFVCQIMKKTGIKVCKTVGDMRFIDVDVVSEALKHNTINMTLYGKEMIKFLQQ